MDFLYPSEGIHRRWDNGYRITSTAATWDQAALILSVPRRKPGDETQETLRTSQFPSTHVKVGFDIKMTILALMNFNYCCGGCRRSGRRICILLVYVMEELCLDIIHYVMMIEDDDDCMMEEAICLFVIYFF